MLFEVEERSFPKMELKSTMKFPKKYTSNKEVGMGCLLWIAMAGIFLCGIVLIGKLVDGEIDPETMWTPIIEWTGN